MKIAGYQVHPLAEVFPLLEGTDFDTLVEDVREHGLRRPVVLFEGKLLDGRNRARACVKAKVKLRTVNLKKGVDALAYVVSENVVRRHLDASQRAMAAARLATLAPGRPKKAEKSAVSQRDAAERFNVDRRSVQHARRVIDSASPEIVAAVEAGNLAVSAAVQVTDLPRREQNKVAKVAREGGNAAHAVRMARRAKKERELVNANPKMPKGKYSVILVDPPWKYGDARPNIAPDNHYPPMELEEICALPVAKLAAKNCILFMWVTSPMALDEAKAVLDAWGFKYKSQRIWEKEGKQPTGHWLLIRHELVYIAVRGDPPPPRVAARRPSTFGARVGRHSEKPGEVHDWIEEMYPKAKRLEMFCRSPREGWTAWGNEIE